MSEDTIKVCLSSDDNYVQHLGVTIASILKNKNNEDKISFLILDGGISDENKEKIKALRSIADFEISFEKVDNSLFKLCPIQDWTHLSIVSYYRIVLPDIRPNWDKIIYLDCDIVVQGSLKELFEIDLGENYLASVVDISSEKHAKRLGIKRYYNSGVLLINSKKWREDNVTSMLFKWIENNQEKIVLHDQDILNTALNDDIQELDECWNTLYLTRSIKEDKTKLENAKIIHYIDKKKPWLRYNGDKFSDKYIYYLGFTQWKNFIKKYKIQVMPKSIIMNFMKMLFEIRNIDQNKKQINIIGFKIVLPNKTKISLL